jgi:hypothetical protein
VKRGVFDTLRRGLDNAVANWALVVIRLLEVIVFLAIAVVGAIAVVVPIIISIGIRFADLDTPESMAGAAELLLQRWALLAWIFLGILFLAVLFVAIHSFVQAGSARVYVDGDRVAGPVREGQRARFHVFSLQRWYAGGAEGWWPVFLLYNIAWGLAGLIMLIPLLPTLTLMILFRESPPALIGTGCIGIIVTLMLMLVVGFVTAMWTTRAVAAWAVRRQGARDALAAGWSAIRGDLARHLLIALAVIVVSMAGSAFFASFSFFAAFGETIGDGALFMLITLPLRILGSVLSSVFSAFVAAWYLASYSAIAVES